MKLRSLHTNHLEIWLLNGVKEVYKPYKTVILKAESEVKKILEINKVYYQDCLEGMKYIDDK